MKKYSVTSFESVQQGALSHSGAGHDGRLHRSATGTESFQKPLDYLKEELGEKNIAGKGNSNFKSPEAGKKWCLFFASRVC